MRRQTQNPITDYLQAVVRRLLIGDGTVLTAGNIADGEFLKRSGESLIGDTPAGGGGGSRAIKDGLDVQYDPTPTVTQTENDEFNSASLDPKWTVITNGTAALDIHTTWKSHIWARFTGGGQSYVIQQNYAPAAGTAFSITVCARMVVRNASNGVSVILRMRNSGDTEGMTSQFVSNAGNVELRLDSLDSGSAANRANNIIESGTFHNGKVYLHLQRSAANRWKTAVSFDGLTWAEINTFDKTFTMHHFRVELNHIQIAVGGIDWVRRDWLTLA